MRSILSELARQDRLLIVDDVKMDAPKTKMLAQKLKTLGADNVLIVSVEFDENLHLSSRNLPYVQALPAGSVDPVSLVAHEKVIMTVDAIKKFEEMLG
jgi:large subunit ribosomal protein L4